MYLSLYAGAPKTDLILPPYQDSLIYELQPVTWPTYLHSPYFSEHLIIFMCALAIIAGIITVLYLETKYGVKKADIQKEIIKVIEEANVRDLQRQAIELENEIKQIREWLRQEREKLKKNININKNVVKIGRKEKEGS